MRINIDYPYSAQINKPIPLMVYLSSPPDHPVSISVLSSFPDVTFSEPHFTLTTTGKKFLAATAKSLPSLGLIDIFLTADGYESTIVMIDLGFEGHLKPSWSEPLRYGTPTTLSLLIIDKDGRPAPPIGDLRLTLESSDGILNDQKDMSPVVITVVSGSRATPQFRLKPRFASGGNVHLTAILKTYYDEHIVVQDQYVFTAQPAAWLLVALALLGGTLHAFYRMLRLPTTDEPVSKHVYFVVLGSSWVAASIGYLFADFDLLGLKLDPNVLRTYPVIGFLFSFIGIDGLISNRIHRMGKHIQNSLNVPKHAPKKETAAQS